MVFYYHRYARQSKSGLGNMVAGIGIDGGFEFLTLFGCGMRTNEHAVSAGLIRGLNDEFLQVVEDVPSFRFIPADICRDVRKNRIFAKIVLNDLWNVRVYDFVVRNAGAGCICKRDTASAVDVHNARYTEQRIGPEG